jgi:hypothetical protein
MMLFRIMEVNIRRNSLKSENGYFWKVGLGV